MSVARLCWFSCRVALWSRNGIWYTFDSSVGRAECVKTSLGRWFESGSKDIFDHLDLNPNEALRLTLS